jgi:hypothetical protein
MTRQTRLTFGLGAVALLALAGAVHLYEQAQALRKEPDPYRIGMQADRFAGVLAQVPPGEVMGYITDQAPGSVVAQAMYFGAQYALAPRLLVWEGKAPKREWVLGNFPRPVDLGTLARERGLKPIRDLGSGVVLLRREGGR